MSNDPLDKSTSIGAELTPAGLNLNAKSRFVAAIDRLCGNIVDLGNIPMERRLTRERAKIEGEQQLIQSITKAAVDRMAEDPDFAERVARNYLGTAFSRQENKDAVVRHALEDLRRDSSAEDAGPELDPAFANKFERHAEDAATEELREKWGRVLAAEIRKPGTVTRRVMRIVDEIDAETAQLFEQLCASRIDDFLPSCLAGELDLRSVARLVGAGLLVDPGFLGQVRVMDEIEVDGRQMWIASVGRRRAITIPREVVLGPNNVGGKEPLQADEGKPSIPVYILTDEGRALSKILPDREEQAIEGYLNALRCFQPTLPIKVYELVGVDSWREKFEMPLAPDNSP